MENTEASFFVPINQFSSIDVEQLYTMSAVTHTTTADIRKDKTLPYTSTYTSTCIKLSR